MLVRPGLELSPTLCCMLFDLISSLEILVFLGWTSTAGTPQCGQRIPYDSQVEAFAVAPQTKFWPPDSLDYRSELILPAENSAFDANISRCLARQHKCTDAILRFRDSVPERKGPYRLIVVGSKKKKLVHAQLYKIRHLEMYTNIFLSVFCHRKWTLLKRNKHTSKIFLICWKPDYAIF